MKDTYCKICSKHLTLKKIEHLKVHCDSKLYKHCFRNMRILIFIVF